MNTNNLETFLAKWGTYLEWAVKEYPTEYKFKINEIPVILPRLRAALIKGSFSHTGPALRRTCKDLGIKQTRKAIIEYLNAPMSTDEALKSLIQE